MVTKGCGYDGKWWRREVVTKGSGDEGEWWRREVGTMGSVEEGKWWRRDVATMGSGEEGKWWRREVVMKGSGDEGRWIGSTTEINLSLWNLSAVKANKWNVHFLWGRWDVLRKGSGDEGKWWWRGVVRKGGGDDGKWWCSSWSCVRSSMRFLKLWLQIALEWLHECCMGYVLGRKPEHETLCFSV